MQKAAFLVLQVQIPADLSTLAIISLHPLAAQPCVQPKEDGAPISQVDASWAQKLLSGLARESSLEAVLMYRGENTHESIERQYYISVGLLPNVVAK